MQAEEAPFDLEADCAAMKEASSGKGRPCVTARSDSPCQAMEGWGTDEMTLTRMICNKTPPAQGQHGERRLQQGTSGFHVQHEHHALQESILPASPKGRSKWRM